MATTLANFAIDNPLLALQSAPQGGGTPAPGSVTGGPGGSIANNTITNTNIALGTVTGGPGGNIANSTITNANIVPGTITGGPGGNIATGTITGGPGGNIAPGTITSTELAPGAAAANINAGPAGAINSSQIAGGPFVSASTHAGNTQFGLVEFDPSGDLTETAANSGIALLKTGAAAANINAGPAGAINSTQVAGGPFVSASTHAGNTQFGVVEFDPSGDLTETAANSGIALLKTGAVTYTKMQNVSQPALLGASAVGPVSEITMGPGLSVTTTPGQLSIDPTTFQKAGNTQFGVVEFDPSGDLKESASNSGIAKVKQPAAGVSETNAGFDSLGNFISSKVGSIVGTAVVNGTPVQFHNILIRYSTTAPIGLQISALSVAGTPGYIGMSEQRWIVDTLTAFSQSPPAPAPADPAVPFVRTEHRVTQNTVAATPVYTYLSTNPTSPFAQYATAWDNQESTTQNGQYERHEFYINDGVDAAGYRVTGFWFTPQSFITIERLQ